MSTITTLNESDNGSVSRGAINANFTNLNNDKLETSVATTTYQAKDATLTALAGLATGANKIPRSIGTDTFDQVDFKDEDNMSSNSDTAVPSQQSVKAYVDNKVFGTANIADNAVTHAKTTNILGTQSDKRLMKHGSNVVTTNAGGDATITFGTAFPTALETVIYTNGDFGVGNLIIAGNPGSSSAAAISFRVKNDAGAVHVGAVRVNWIAVGY